VKVAGIKEFHPIHRCRQVSIIIERFQAL